MEFKDYYHILGVSKTATQKDIQKAYRKLAQKHHPDVNKNAGAENRFKEIGEAYDVLKDPDKRAKYDRYGAAWQAAEAGHQTPPGFNGIRFDFESANPGQGKTFFDILEHLFENGASNGFGGFRGSHNTLSTRGEDFEVLLSLSLEEAINGGKQTLSLTDPYTGQRKSYTVTIPAGVTSGRRIRLSGQGGVGMGGGPTGDLYLIVDIKPHNRFELQGQDLYTTLDVTPSQAALGAKVALETVTGRVRVTVPEGSSSGRKIRIKGHGFPGENGKGDLYAELRIVVPEHITAKERELYKKLAEAR